MERFNNKITNAYDTLSKYYDALLSDEESLKLWINYFNKEKYNTVLELASGTGLMAKLLKNDGKCVIASDISKNMKLASQHNFDGEYLILDMSNFNINKKFDLIICICDSFNYLSIDKIDSFFNSCFNHLNDGGRLIFDMHNIKRIEEFSDEYIEEGNVCGTNYQFTIVSDPIANIINENFAFYFDDQTINESHIQYVYDVSYIVDKMRNIGYNVETIDDFIKDEKVLLIGKKK